MIKTKRQIRVEILNILDNQCRDCSKKKEFQNLTTKSTVEHICINECSVAIQLQDLGRLLDADQEVALRGKWTTDETFYLMNNAPVLGFEKVAERLNLPVEKVKLKYDYELTKAKKKTPHVAV